MKKKYTNLTQSLQGNRKRPYITQLILWKLWIMFLTEEGFLSETRIRSQLSQWCWHTHLSHLPRTPFRPLIIPAVKKLQLSLQGTLKAISFKELGSSSLAGRLNLYNIIQYHLSLTLIPGWMNHKLESRLLGEIATTSDMQMIPL